MTAIPYYPDVPSPTNRDSTASAIFNLYDYSTRESVTEASNKDQTYGVQSGLCGSQERNALQEHDAEQMEELQSPQIAEGPTYKTRSRTSSRRSRRASSIVQALNGLSQGDWKDSDAANGASSTAPSYVVLAAPVAGHPAVATDGPGEHARYNGEAADDKLHISTPNEVSGRPSSVQSVLSRHSQHSLHIFEPSTQPISDNGTRTQPPDQGYMARTGELQPTDLFQSAQEQEPSRPSTSLANFTSTRQPGEEEDAYHVRATYARLEVQGVFGDGWEEGIERTRERAVVSKRRGSRAPLARSDILVEEERKALAKVDRYGFFDQALKTRQENRVYRIPAQVYRKIPKVPRGPPKRTKAERGGADMMAGGSEDTTGAVPQSISPQEIERLDVSRGEMFRQKEAERVGKWERMLLVADRDPGGNAVKWKWEDGGKGAKLRERVYKGIPDRWRSAAWTALTDAKPRGIQSRSGPQPDVGQLLEKYRTALDVPSTFDVQIDLDVPRTISGHILFHTRYGHGQRSLFHVLHCFSSYCSECGYCQGMGPIAATFLCYFEPARVYALLVRLHDVYDMHRIFIHGFPGLLENFYVQERLIEHIMPDVYTSFERNMISASSYATKWYITLFANTVPFQTQLRIWDALLLEGQDLLVMTSVALIYAYRSVLTAPNATFETILSTLSAFYIPEDEDAMMQWISIMMGGRETRSMMDGWRKDWHELVRTEKDGTALL